MQLQTIEIYRKQVESGQLQRASRNYFKILFLGTISKHVGNICLKFDIENSIQECYPF